MLSRIDLTAAARPQLLPDETILTVQSAVGLYEGKYKIPIYQNGHAYLTSHRACYVDIKEPRSYAVAVELKDVERVEPYAGFLKSSPKISLHLKHSGSKPSIAPPSPRTHTQLLIRSTSPIMTNRNWVCSICSYSNPAPSNYVPGLNNPDFTPPCLACGIKPAPTALDKALSKRSETTVLTPIAPKGSSVECPRCTFHNHPSLFDCEICGETLRASASGLGEHKSTNPSSPLNSHEVKPLGDIVPVIKFSFRSGGDKVFLSALRSALIQQKWRLQHAPSLPAPQYNDTSYSGIVDSSTVVASSTSTGVTRISTPKPQVGIAGLEAKGLNMRKKNEQVLGGAFEDLEALMSRAQEVISIAESFASKLNNTQTFADSEAQRALRTSTVALGLVSKDMMGGGDRNAELYISELARQVAEFLSDDTTSILKREGGVITLVDLWAVYNRARGIDLISPADLEKACQCFERLRLPVRLRKFKSGLLVVQDARASDAETVRRILKWLGVERGCMASEAAMTFGWSFGVAMEELEIAEEMGAVCRDVTVEGIRFWSNRFQGSANVV